MAPLKRLYCLFRRELWSCYHGWKVVAPLKHESVCRGVVVAGDVTMAERSWLHWNHQSFDYLRLFIHPLPWLRSRGSIETRVYNVLVSLPCSVTMAEKSWLHWNSLTIFWFISPAWVTMAEKSWLHWNLSFTLDHASWSASLPWLKGRGSIETNTGEQSYLLT